MATLRRGTSESGARWEPRHRDPAPGDCLELVIDGTVSNLACGFDIPTTTQVGFGGGLKPGQGDCFLFGLTSAGVASIVAESRDGESEAQPRRFPRGASIVSSLEYRIAEAEAEERGWTGEVQQLRVSLQGARDKIAQTSRPDGPVLLNIPVLRPPN